MRISDWSSDVCSSDLAGARARASSIHVNAWFGDYDKATMAAELLADDLGIDPQEQSRRVLVIGDATNGETTFRACAQRVGVGEKKNRKRVGEGKGVCRRGYIGGEGIIKTKKKKVKKK